MCTCHTMLEDTSLTYLINPNPSTNSFPYQCLLHSNCVVGLRDKHLSETCVYRVTPSLSPQPVQWPVGDGVGRGSWVRTIYYLRSIDRTFDVSSCQEWSLRPLCSCPVVSWYGRPRPGEEGTSRTKVKPLNPSHFKEKVRR